MYIDDFYFDNVSAKSKGFMICSFNGGSSDDVTFGVPFQYQTSKSLGTNRNHFHSSVYDEPISFKIQLCKYNHVTHIAEKINSYEVGEVIRWISQDTGYQPLEIITSEYEHLVFNAYINLSRIEIAGDTCGFQLDVTTDSSFCYSPIRQKTFVLNEENDFSFCINDMSDKIGYQYPDITITCKESGNLKLYNTMTGDTTEINHCVHGEIIFINGNNQIVRSIFDSHKIYDDFNFKFPKIMNTKFERDNTFISNIPIEVTLSYNVIRLVGGVS